MLTSLLTKAARRSSRTSASQIARAAVESLETRRLLSYALDATLSDTGSNRLGDWMVTRGDFVLTNDSQASGTDGVAHLFDADGSGMPLRTFTAPANEGFGGGLAFIGEPDPTDADSDNDYGHVAFSTITADGIGRVYIYDLDPAALTPVTIESPFLDAGPSMVLFGWALYSWNDYLLVSSQSQGTTADAGSLRVYTKDGTDTEVDFADSKPGGGASGDQFGFRSAVSGNTLVTTTAGMADTVAMQFTLGIDGLSGLPQATHVRTYANPSGNGAFTFGSALALDGNDLFVSGHADANATQGAVYQFDASGAGTTAAIDTYTGAVDELFGIGIAAANGQLAIGATGASTDEGGPQSGAVFVYDYDSDANTAQDEPEIIANPNPALNHSFGVRVGAISGGRFAVSDASRNADAGAIYVFAPVPDEPQAVTATIDGDGNLIVSGTVNGETIEIRSAGTAAVDVYVNSVLLGNFAPTGKIIINAGDGDDAISVNGDVLFNADVFGGIGNDSIVGGGGNDFLSGGAGNDHLTSRNASDILLGGDGNDVLLGGNGRDLLIGGDGADMISGDNAEDILVAGWTDHDTDRASLDSIQAIWNGGGSRDERVAILSTGLLAANHVHADGDPDSMYGGNGTDYFVVDVEGEALDVTRRE